MSRSRNDEANPERSRARPPAEDLVESEWERRKHLVATRRRRRQKRRRV